MPNSILRLLILFIGVLSSMPLVAQEKHALLIGVAKYSSSHMNENQLQFPEDDATAVAAVLTNSGYTVKTLVGKQASQKNVQDALTNLSKQGHDDGVVSIGLFGHGVQYGNNAFFCPWDTSVRIVTDSQGNKVRDSNSKPKLEPDPESLVSMREILDSLTVSNAGNKVLLADCCRDDPSRARGRAFGSKLRVADLPSGTAALFACSANEQAFEHKDWGHGAFTQSLLDQLQTADNQLTANTLSVELYRSVAKRVSEKTKGQSSQTVNLIINGVVDLKLTQTSSPQSNDSPQADLEKQRQEMTALLDTPEIQNLMGPFFTKSLARVEIASLANFAGTPIPYKVSKDSRTKKQPMSLRTIKRSGALKINGSDREKDLALRQLVVLARVENDQRPDWRQPRSEADWDSVRKAQALLEEHGGKMVEYGYLSE